MFEKVKDFAKKQGGKFLGALTGVGVTASTAVTAFAAEGTDADAAKTAIQSILSNVTGTLNITNIASIIGIGLGAVVGIFLAWWGARKLVGMLMTAFKKGRVSL